MKPNSRILVPTDFSPIAKNAFLYAISLASELGGSVTVLHTFRTDLGVPAMDNVAEEILEGRHKAAEAELKEFIHTGYTEKVEIQTRLESGLPNDVLAVLTTNGEYDMVVMGTHREHNWLEHTFGSFTSTTVRDAACVVIAVPENYIYQPMEDVAFATDLHEYSLHGALEALELARQTKGELHCVHISLHDNRNDAVAMQNLNEFLQINSKGVPFQLYDHNAKSVAQGLEHFVKDEGMDVLLMVRPKRGFFEQLFHRSQTNEVILRPTVPTWIIPADIKA